MRQRAMIAMALACGPKLLIADEPTTALDVTIQAQIIRLIKEMQQKFNMSVLLITHDLGVVADIAQNIAVVYAGRIVEYGARDGHLLRPAPPLHLVPAPVHPPGWTWTGRSSWCPLTACPPT